MILVFGQRITDKNPGREPPEIPLASTNPICNPNPIPIPKPNSNHKAYPNPNPMVSVQWFIRPPGRIRTTLPDNKSPRQKPPETSTAGAYFRSLIRVRVRIRVGVRWLLSQWVSVRGLLTGRLSWIR